MKKSLFTFTFTCIIMAWALFLSVACKTGIPGPQNAISASARLISISPKMNAPVSPSDADLENNSPNHQLPLQSQIVQ